MEHLYPCLGSGRIYCQRFCREREPADHCVIREYQAVECERASREFEHAAGDVVSTACPQANQYVQKTVGCGSQFSDVTVTSPEGINLDVIGYNLVNSPAPAPTDFNNDGKPDYLLFNASTRQTVLWYLKNNVLIGAASGPTLSAGYRLVGVADFNRDGHPDYLLFNPSTRQTAIWYLNKTVLIGTASGPTLSSAWELVATGDFNKDGKPDWLIYIPSTQRTLIWY